MSSVAQQFTAAAADLTRRLRRWSLRSWAVPVDTTGSRADAAHAAVQRLADLAALAEGRPARPVPRLGSDLALPDQLAVTAADVARSGDAAAIRTATAELARLRRALGLR